MAWLRIDDGFDHHPKILQLGSDQRRWTWIRILVYTCRYRSPVIPTGIADSVPRASRQFLRECVELGLIDVTDDGTMEVHDWVLYNADTIEEKVEAYLVKYPDATANDVHRAVGGKREIVLACVKQYQNGSQPVPVSVPQAVPGTVPGNRESGSQSGSRARAPLPVPVDQEPAPAPTSTTDTAREPDPHGTNGAGAGAGADHGDLERINPAAILKGHA